MVNFSSLKQSIQNYIKENGNKEITGNLLQEILLSMVVTMGDNAINGVLQSLSNEMISRENADGLLNQALTAEQQRAIAAETKSAVLDGETKTLVFKNAAGQELYHVSVASLIANGLVDVEVDGTNLVMTFHTESGDEEITIPIGDIFSPSNYYTKTQVDNLLSSITTAITNVSSRLNAGYIYLGLADPETIPTSATGKFFYIASQAGTYHFMANGDIPIVISSNGLYILSGGVEADDWYLETIVTFTNNVQFNSSRLITSGGVFNAILPIYDLLRRNYMLAGVADTTTTPTEDTNVFYLAGQGGTYTHFLNGDDEPLDLPKGLTVIYRGVEDDGWNYWVVYADNDFINTNRAQALTSDQQTEAQNNLEGKSYAPAQFSGLGKKMLAKNIQQVSGVQKNVMTQAFFQDEHGNALTNTVFVIQYDYTLGENITIPAGCTLQFDGGSINSGGSDKDTLTGNKTRISADLVKVFDTNLIFAGSWDVAESYPEWFYESNWTTAINKAFSVSKRVFLSGVYSLSNTEKDTNGIYIHIPKYCTLTSNKRDNVTESDYNISVGTSTDCKVISMDMSSAVSNIGIFVNKSGTPNVTGIYINKKSRINIHRCVINTVDVGIDCTGYLINISNTHITNTVIGFKFNKYSETAQATSINLNSCWVTNSTSYAYYFNGVCYSILLNCAADNCCLESGEVYAFYDSNEIMVMASGCETCPSAIGVYQYSKHISFVCCQFVLNNGYRELNKALRFDGCTQVMLSNCAISKSSDAAYPSDLIYVVANYDYPNLYKYNCLVDFKNVTLSGNKLSYNSGYFSFGANTDSKHVNITGGRLTFGPTGYNDYCNIGDVFFNTTTNKPMWYKGNNEWVYADGSIVQ